VVINPVSPAWTAHYDNSDRATAIQPEHLQTSVPNWLDENRTYEFRRSL
jgi:hypothetical protein